MRSTHLRSIGWALALAAVASVLAALFCFAGPGRDDPEPAPLANLGTPGEPELGEFYWSSSGRDFRGTSYQPLPSASGGIESSPQWRTRLTDEPLPLEELNLFAPLVYDGENLYTGDTRGRMYSVDAGSGEVLWERSMEIEAGLPASGPLGATAVSAEYLFTARNHPRSGHFWSVPTGSPDRARKLSTESGFFASPLAGEETVWAPALDGRVYVVDPEDPSPPQAELELGSKPYSPPLRAGEKVVIGSNDGRIVAFDAETGRQEWTHSTPGFWLQTSPVIYDSNVLVCGVAGELIALSLEDGRREWSLELGPSCNTSLVLIEQRDLLVAAVFPFGETPPAELVAVDLEDRAVEWRRELPLMSSFQMVGAGNYLYALQRSDRGLYEDTESWLVTVNLRTGERTGRLRLPVPDATWLAVVEDGLAVRLLDGSVAKYPFRNPPQ